MIEGSKPINGLIPENHEHKVKWKMQDVHLLELVTWHDKGKMEMQDVHLLELVTWHDKGKMEMPMFVC